MPATREFVKLALFSNMIHYYTDLCSFGFLQGVRSSKWGGEKVSCLGHSVCCFMGFEPTVVHWRRHPFKVVHVVR
uniref:Uncharacterized protein n=1 Tax=Aegilops tauschii subsp. strangulata TaxID=200361 RepID=A0A453KIN0_AEGTS